MSKTNGHILVIPEGLETQHITQSRRDRIVSDFLDMKSIAERDGDHVYADNDIYSHKFSYGYFYQDLVYLSWPELQQKTSLNGITQNTHQLIARTYKNPGFLKCSDSENFLATHKHATHAGLNIPNPPCHYIYDDITRLQWHEEWYRMNPKDIIWPDNHDLFPCHDKIVNILKRELEKHGKVIPANDSETASAFHRDVMNCKGPIIHAYANEIGTEICISNYYKEEPVLSRLESEKKQGTLRKIFSIINKQGKKQFLSIDFKHGMFEYLDHTGTHQGEYKFDGSYHKKEKPEDHSLLCMKEWEQMGCP